MPGPHVTRQPNPARARLATAAVFALNGFIYASWVLHVPTIRDRLDLSPAALGLALLAIAAGSLFSMPLAGNVIQRVGSGRVTRLFAFLNPVALVPMVLAPNLATLVLALVVYGALTGALDVAMNAQGVAVERRLNRPVLSSFHAAWSLGSLAGAALGTLALAAGMATATHVLSVAVTFLLVAAIAAPALLPAGAELYAPGPAPSARGTRRWSFRLLPGVLLLGSLGFLGLLGEGAMADWSGVYYRDVLGVAAGLTGVGYVAFTLAMTVGRVFGDTARARLGGRVVVIGGAALAALGLAGALFMQAPLLAAVGFGLFGLGVANIVPVLFDAASRGNAAGPAIAQVSTLGYLGFLAGPPLLGFVAEATSLKAALGVVAAFVALIALLSARAIPPRPAD